MQDQVEHARRAETLGFSCLWLQDVLLEDPSFEDPATGQIYDSLIYLTYLASHTRTIKLGTAAVVFPLRHPLRTAKEVASIERLFPGRLVLGISSGDRRKDFSALNIPIMERGEWFRESYAYFTRILYEEFPHISSPLGTVEKANLVPKPTRSLPIYMTGYCQQSIDWIAQHGDGWMFYPQRPEQQKKTIQTYRETAAYYQPHTFKPFLMPMPLELMDQPDYPPEKIPAGYRIGRHALLDLLEDYRKSGVNHIFFNLAQSSRPVAEVLEELGTYVLPAFSNT